LYAMFVSAPVNHCTFTGPLRESKLKLRASARDAVGDRMQARRCMGCAGLAALTCGTASAALLHAGTNVH